MNQQQLENFRQKLLELQLELQETNKAGESGRQTVVLDQSSVGRLSRMDAMQAQQMALETTRRRQQQLHRISSSMRRIESGDYGDCVECGEAIDPRRLMFDPTSTLCIDCAGKL